MSAAVAGPAAAVGEAARFPVRGAFLARAAGVKALVLSHLTQAGLPFYTPEAFTKGMDDGGKLDWRLAFDGMTIDLPVGSDEVRFGKY